jgi:transposase
MERAGRAMLREAEMSQRRRVEVTEEQRAELLRVVKHDPKAYRRERAAAILKVAAGEVAARVAAQGLLVRRDPDSVYGWLDRYRQHGVAGLTIAPGRGRKRRLSPPVG